MFSLYILYNKINGKMYVGITANFVKRWARHKSIAKSKNLDNKQVIHLAIEKYGSENFIAKEIEKLKTWKDACKKETDWIKSLKDHNYELYNQTNGGEGTYGFQLFAEMNGNFGKSMKPHVKNELLKHRRKLSDSQIASIKDLYSKNYTQTEIAKQFSVSLTQIHRIVHGKSWGSKDHEEVLTKKHLTKENTLRIKHMYASGNYKQKELACMFNISLNHVSRIINSNKLEKS